MKFAVGNNSPETIVVLNRKETLSLINNATQVRPTERQWLLAALDDFSRRDLSVVMRLTEYLEMIGRR